MRSPKTVAVIGATGAVGGTFLSHLMRRQLLQPHDELFLVGHGVPASDSRLLAERIDLQDAFDEQEVTIRFAPDPSSFEADVVVVAAGITIGPDHPTRRDLASANVDIFRHLAQVCVQRQPSALFIVVSNPVELAVDLFSRVTDPRHVLGMGAQQDSLRFARAVAEKLGVTRHQVHASVLGEHGASMFPVWSSVVLMTGEESLQMRLADLRNACPLSSLTQRVTRIRSEVDQLVQNGAIPEAYTRVLQADPDVRIFVEPFITARLLHSTPNATSNATLDCVEAALSDSARKIHGQVRCSDGLVGDSVCGLPVWMNRHGWRSADEPTMTQDERSYLNLCLLSIANSIQDAEACGGFHSAA